MSAACHCPTHPGRRTTDELAHRRWHAEVVEQGGPAGLVTTEALQAARGHAVTAIPDEPLAVRRSFR